MAWEDLKEGIEQLFEEAQHAASPQHHAGLWVRSTLRTPKPHYARAEESRRYRNLEKRRRLFVVSEKSKTRVFFTEACRRAGVAPGTVRQRLMLGWSMDRALGTPTRRS